MSSGFILEEGEVLIVNLGVDFSIQVGDSVLFDFEVIFMIDSVIWLLFVGLSVLNSFSIFVILVEIIIYVLIVFFDNGCSGIDFIIIIVELIDGKVFVFNVFSFNDDGVNDCFIVYVGEDVINVEDFQVFDCWGNQFY